MGALYDRIVVVHDRGFVATTKGDRHISMTQAVISTQRKFRNIAFANAVEPTPESIICGVVWRKPLIPNDAIRIPQSDCPDEVLTPCRISFTNQLCGHRRFGVRGHQRPGCNELIERLPLEYPFHNC